MSKFVGGLITGSVLTLVGIGIAAAISDGTLSNSFDTWDILSDEDDSDKDSDDTEDTDDSEEGEDSKKDDSPIAENIKEKAEKAGYGFGTGLGMILNAAAAGAESFEKSLTEELDNSDESSEDEDDDWE